MMRSVGTICVLVITVVVVQGGDLNRQSIIFNENTPDVFYCPQVSHTHTQRKT